MRRAGTTVLAAVMLALPVAITSCGPAPAKSGPAAEPPSMSVLGATAPGQVPVAVQNTNAGVDSASVPKAAFANKADVAGIVTATGATTVSRERAIEIATPAETTANVVPELISAVHVVLPAKFVRAVSGRTPSSVVDAWLVTFGRIQRAGSGLDDRSTLIDAGTGAVIATSQYPQR